MSLISLHRYEEALPRLLYCIENWNFDDSYLGTLINIYGRLAICYGYLKNWKLLKNTLQTARKLSPGHIDLDIIYAHLLLYQGTNNSQEIPAFLNEQTTRDPSSYALYYWKGQYTRDYLQDVPGSVELFRAALEKLNYVNLHISQQHHFFAPQQYAASWYVLKSYVDVCMQLNKQHDVFWQIRSSRIKRIVTSTDVQVLLVYLDILNESLDVAEDKCRRTLAKKISIDAQTEYWLLLTLVQIERGNFEEALASINQVLALDSEKLEAWKTLGLIQMKTRAWNKAIQTFQLLVGKDYFDFRCWEYLGNCYMYLGDHSSAKHSYEQAAKLNPLRGDASQLGLGL